MVSFDFNLTTVLSIVATILSCGGNFFIIYKKKAGFVVWTLGNAVWIWVDVQIAMYPQIIMMVFYAALNILGYIEWSKSEETQPKEG